MSHIANLFFHLYLIFTRCMHSLYVWEGQSAWLLIKIIYWRDRVTWALLSWENPSSVNQVEMLNAVERHTSLLSERRIWGFWAFWNCTNNNKHTVWCPLGTIQWTWCKTCFFMSGRLHVLFSSGFTNWEESSW